MRPWQHAISSAGSARDWRDDLPLHEFMDLSKGTCASLHHRMVLHNADFGPELAARAFAERPDAREIALRHTREDLGVVPSLAEWLALCDLKRMPQPLARRRHAPMDDIVEQLAERHRLDSEAPVRDVLEILALPVQFAGEQAASILLNCFGPVLVSKVLGGPREIAGKNARKAMLDPAHIAEGLIHWTMGAIPSLEDVVLCLRIVPTHQYFSLEPGEAAEPA